MTEETRDGPTPNGGVKATAYYQDDAGQPAEKDQATQVVIVEYDAAGEPIHRTYGVLSGNKTQDFRAPGPPPRPGLVWKEETSRWVRVNGSDAAGHEPESKPAQEPAPAGGGQPAAPPAPADSEQADNAQAASGIVDALPDGAGSKPGVREKLTNAYNRVKLFLFERPKIIDTVGEVLGAYFDTPQDMAKFGYNPNTSSGTANPQVGDPLKDYLGVGNTHMLTTIAAKLLGSAFVYAKRKLKGQTADEAHEEWLKKQPATHAAGEFTVDDLDAATEALAELLAMVNEELGLEGGIDRAKIRASLDSLAAK